MIFLAILEYAILASTFTISKVAVSFSDPLFLIGIRMVTSALLLFLFQKLRFNISKKIIKSDYFLFIQVAIFHIFLPFAGEFWALQYVSSIKTAIIYSLTPFIAAFLSFLLLKERLSVKQSLGLIIGLLGIIPIFLTGSVVENDLGQIFEISLPELVLLGAVISASYAWFLVKKLMNKGYAISQINAVSMLLGGVMSLILWFNLSTDFSPIKEGNFASFVFWTSLLIIVANIISYNFYGWLLRYISINLMGATGFFCPIFASFYGWFFLDESLNFFHLVALLMVIIGLWLFYQDELKKKPNDKSST